MDNGVVEQIVACTIDEVSIANAYDFRVPPLTVVGDGISVKIGDHVKKLGCKKVFVVTDKQIVRLGLLEPMLRSFAKHSIDHVVFDEVEPDPTDVIVKRGISKLLRCDCDSVLTFGGGSPIDAGKAIALFATNTLDLDRPPEYDASLSNRLPLVAVPTTAGTGSEVTDVAVITNSRTHVKILLVHPFIIPDVAVIDPRLTVGIPPGITAATGMDVMTHAVEAYVSLNACTLGLALSWRAIRLVGKNLRAAVGYGQDLEARHKMAVASYMAGMAFSNSGLGLCHAMAHQLGGKSKLPHGICNSLLLPEVMRFNMLVRIGRLQEIATALDQRVENLDPKDAALKSIQAIEELREDIGLPTRLRDVGVRREDFQEMAEQALEDPSLEMNPRSVTIEDALQVYELAF
jgi:alcohol dehydrogenase class IV